MSAEAYETLTQADRDRINDRLSEVLREWRFSQDGDLIDLTRELVAASVRRR